MGQAPPLLALVVTPVNVMASSGVLQEAGEVLGHTVVLRVVGGVTLDRGQFKGVGRGLGWRGERQFVMMVVRVVMGQA